MSSLWKRCAGTALAVAVGVSVASAVAGAQTSPLTLNVDLTDAPRKIFHSTEVMPVTAGGPAFPFPRRRASPARAAPTHLTQTQAFCILGTSPDATGARRQGTSS